MKKFLLILSTLLLIIYAGCMVFLFVKSGTGTEEQPTSTPASADEVATVEVISYEEDRIALEEEINNIIFGKPGTWSVYVKNLKTGMSLEINNREFIAASVIKLYNMIALYDEIENGNLEMTDSIENNLEQMITVSSNSASNAIVTTIGRGSFDDGAEKVTDCAESLGCMDTYEQHMLYDDHIPSNGRNRTSVVDCGVVLEKIYLKQCISEEYDAEMLELLKQQTKDFKIPANLPDDVVVANKTGENSNVEADVGIVFSPECDYIICISVEKYGERKPRDIIAEISECVYNFFNNKEESQSGDSSFYSS